MMLIRLRIKLKIKLQPNTELGNVELTIAFAGSELCRNERTIVPRYKFLELSIVDGNERLSRKLLSRHVICVQIVAFV